MQEPYEIISWEDAPLRPLRTYTCYDVDGIEVELQPKDPAKHESWHPVQDDPALFYNLRTVVSEPEETSLSVSKNPVAIENGQKGKIVVYSHSNLTNKIDFPGQPTLETKVDVVMLYPHDGTKPHSLTYIIGPRS